MIKRTKKNFIIILLMICALFLIACKKKTYVVVFDYNYDNIISTQEVKEGEMAIKPKDPERLRYNFGGWYTDVALTIPYNENTQIHNNTTFYAKWESTNAYIIRYHLNGGSLSDEAITKFVDYSEVKLIAPTKDNYEFDGWYENGKLISEIKENRDYNLVAQYHALYGNVDALIMSPIRTETKIYKDITYKIVGGVEVKLDMYLPPLNDGEKCPVLFIFFGGGFIGGDKSQVGRIDGNGYLQEIFDYALDNNIAVIMPNYRLSNGNTVTFPLPVEDSLDAIRFCVKNSAALGIDINNMGTTGYSSGAYMALMAAFAKNNFFGDPGLKEITYNIKYVINLYAPSFYDKDVLTTLNIKARIMLSNFLGNIYTSPDDFAYVMPSYYVDEASPDVYIIHGNQDALVPLSQSVSFHSLLLEKGISSKLLIVEGADHMLETASGFSEISPSYKEVNDSICEFISTEVNK